MLVQAPAVGKDATTKPFTTTATGTDTVSFIGAIARLFKPGDRLAQVNSMRGGAQLACCFGRTEFFDPTPYAEALSKDYPCLIPCLRGDWDAGCYGEQILELLETAAVRGSAPMAIAGLLAAIASDAAEEICGCLSEMDRRKILFLLSFSQVDPEYRLIFV